MAFYEFTVETQFSCVQAGVACLSVSPNWWASTDPCSSEHREAENTPVESLSRRTSLLLPQQFWKLVEPGHHLQAENVHSLDKGTATEYSVITCKHVFRSLPKVTRTSNIITADFKLLTSLASDIMLGCIFRMLCTKKRKKSFLLTRIAINQCVNHRFNN